VTRWIERELPPEATYVDVKACNWKEEAVVRLYVYTRPAWADAARRAPVALQSSSLKALVC
jgi:hypothetical protein